MDLNVKLLNGGKYHILNKFLIASKKKAFLPYVIIVINSLLAIDFNIQADFIICNKSYVIMKTAMS